MDAKANSKTKADLNLATYLRVLILGIVFGIILTKSEVARWERVHNMFLFKEAHMYLIIGLGIAVAMSSLFLIRRFSIKTMQGELVKYSPKPFQRGVIFGGLAFGAGWAVTGACPGPIYAQLGGGEFMAIFTLAGALLGMFTYAYLKPRLPH